MSIIYTLGETVLDIALKELDTQFAVPGGSALNTSVSLGRLGANVEFITELGDDEVGSFISAFLKKNNIATTYSQRYPNTNTSIALAFLNEENNATYTFYKKLPDKRIINTGILFTPNDFLLFCSSFAINSTLRIPVLDILDRCKQSDTIIYYDPNIRFTPKDNEFEQKKAYALENIQKSTILRGSDDDFEILFGAKSADEAYHSAQGLGIRFFIYTQSNKGVYIYIDQQEYFFKSKNITPISTIGAGDTFNAGILFGLNHLKKTNNNIYNLTKTEVEFIAQTAIEAATFVCMSNDNYISNEYTSQLLSRL